MKEKSSKGLLIWLIIFIIISLAMGGYIAYDKFLNKKENVTSVSSKDEQKSSTKEEVQETYHSLAIKDNKCIDSECNSDYSVVNYFDLGSITIEDNIAKIRLTKDKFMFKILYVCKIIKYYDNSAEKELLYEYKETVCRKEKRFRYRGRRA